MSRETIRLSIMVLPEEMEQLRHGLFGEEKRRLRRLSEKSEPFPAS